MGSPLADLFVRFAPSYDRVNHLLSLGLDARWRARLIAAIDERPAPRILDLCAGTLSCTRAVLARFPDAAVTAADFCGPMLEIGRSKLTPSARGRVQTICADVLDLEFPPASFDVAICSFGMRHLPAPALLLDRLHAWLTPQGQLLIFDFFRPTRIPARIFQATAGRYLLPAAGEMLKGFGGAYRQLHESIERFVSREAFERTLAEHGFSVQRAQDVTLGIASLLVARPR